MKPHSLSAVLCTVIITSAASAQLKVHPIEKLGVLVRADKKFAPVPLRLGRDALGAAIQAKFLPGNEKDTIFKGFKFDWGMHVLAFNLAKAAVTGPKKDGEGKPTKEEAIEAARAEILERFRSKNFLEFVTEKDPTKSEREFVHKGKAVKAKGKRLAYKYYEYYDQRSMLSPRGTGQDTFWFYKFAAVYTIEHREIVLVFHWPVFKKPKPDKHKRTAKKMIESLQLLKEGYTAAKDAGAKTKDKFANTKERKESLKQAISNIKGLKGWDYYTTPNFICLYSWDAAKPAKKKKSRDFARKTTDGMEQIRELYLKYYPPTERALSNYYPVLRICHTKELFDQYGGTSGGVVGWFNPGSKELVIFNDVDGVWGGKKQTKSTAFHEGWHQYANAYFGEGVELNRWFGEGTGDWFGGWTKVGGRWVYKPAMGRIRGAAGIQGQVARKTFVPLKEIIHWNKPKFYGPRAVYYYAQGYAMVDFLRRGKKLMGGKWDKSWDNILDNYRKLMLESKGDQKKATEAAFGQVDMKKFEAAFTSYVKRYITKK